MNDQPLKTMVGMEQALKTYRAFRARDNAPNAVEFAKRHPDTINYCFFVDELRDSQ